ncbi:MAG: TIGR03619 family F420-dependent LLM class oxidoreductase [Myxococcota bacterium]
MKIGVAIRVMGPGSDRATIERCARIAEGLGLDDVWVSDHLAIAPDEAEGSGGRYLDPLATLAFLAGTTERVGLGTAVLNLPYRPPLPTAKWLATIQELSGERLLLGVGLGWMESEFQALGVDRRRRGALADATLEFLGRCFERDRVEAHGQEFLFLPRPSRPPILVGGGVPHALHRAARYGEGWMPMLRGPETLAGPVEMLGKLFREAGKPPPEVAVLTGFPRDDPAASGVRVAAFEAAGATRLIAGFRYADAAEFRTHAEAFARAAGRRA